MSKHISCLTCTSTVFIYCKAFVDAIEMHSPTHTPSYHIITHSAISIRVIQYIAWADGAPRAEKDHGTWCGGASVGKCINASSLASAYNGLASDAKIAVFDVDAGGNWLDVPSLYDISLPPAYSAGTNITTTPHIPVI